MNISSKNYILLVPLILAAVLILPSIASRYVVAFMVTLFMTLALVQSWNLIGGYCGYYSFGQSCFFGIGAYTIAILTVKFGWPVYISMPLAAVVPLLFALAIGYPSLRARGPYFIVLTIAINEIMRLIVTDRQELTGGMIGIASSFILSETSTYYVMSALALTMTFVIYVTGKSRYGSALLSIKEDEDVAEVFGVNTARYKVIAFALSGIIPGLVGAVTFLYWGYMEPTNAFNLTLSFQMVLVALLGGAGTVIGPIIGTIFFTISSETLGIYFPSIHLAIFGALMIFVIFFLPSGLVGFNWRKLHTRLGAFFTKE